ncbi:TonB-dependent receptor [Flavivirga sp. 57AJ16]|uniref:SusC/RagA family TonB-linked outer membrane protein n=1 Tax=Flavivirga sp. 57AJ16 TaxID=3025307 RepID=UPI002366FB2F|nr:TonB-dependent receptor [Flavivirga sp. 57AJ16]
MRFELSENNTIVITKNRKTIVVKKPQKIVISGIISDENGQPLPGANVLEKGTSNGTQTDFDGEFSLNVSDKNAILVISYIGFVSEEVRVNEQTNLNIKLKEDAAALEEVVLIGYGTQRKSDVTGAVGTVSGEKLKERSATSLNEALAGRISGVQVNTNSGRPGGRSNVRIRGFSSINSSNNPLYVIDGVQLPQGDQAQFSTAIDYLNPSDIASIEVLKDASSTAIYGSRGANGVILITTKRGKAGQGRVTYDMSVNIKEYGPNRVDVLNAEEYAMIEQLSWENAEKFDPDGWAAGNYVDLEPSVKRAGANVAHLFDANGKPLYDTDWAKVIQQHNVSSNHQLGFSGGNEKTTYAFSIGYKDEQGLLINSYLQRHSVSFAVDDQLKSWLKVGGTLSYNSQKENLVDTDDQVPRRMVEDFPFLPVIYEGGPLEGAYANNRDYPNAEGTRSSLNQLISRKRELNTQTTSGSMYTNIDIMPDLQMKTVVGVNIMTQNRNEFNHSRLSSSGVADAQANSIKQTFWSFENYLTYNKTINKNNSFTALLGVSWQESDAFSFGASSRDFPTDIFEYNNLGAGSDGLEVRSSANRHALNSYFGRINYNFMNKYLFTITGRADGSSKFGDNNKFAFFPSAAFGWKISEEDFLVHSESISNLKLRMSYGLTGNSEIPPYSSLSLLSSGYTAIWNDSRIGGTGLNRLANPDLKWEKTAQTDIGVELGLFNGRVNIEADYYYRKTTDMLLDAPVPQSSGYATIRKNIGSMENKGFEFGLNTINITNDNFSWKTSFNISLNKNKVLSLATPSDIFGVGAGNFTNPTNIIRVGESVGSFWGLTRLGTWNTDEAAEAAKFVSYRGGKDILPGDIKYLDVNGDYVINDADRKIIGNGSPDAWGAFTNYITYKNFDFTLELQYSVGNDVMNMNLHSSEDRQALANSYRTVLNAWTPDNQDTPIAQVRETKAGYITNVDTHWIQDGSFIRGKNLMLGYKFNENVLGKLHLSKLRIYASAQNLFLITADELLGDPEVTPARGDSSNNVFSQGQMWHEYPKPTTFTMGLQIGL